MYFRNGAKILNLNYVVRVERTNTGTDVEFNKNVTSVAKKTYSKSMYDEFVKHINKY
ncbi:hypothetical protein [Spiroplasma sp. ChiS]|uniref:hypothetical protein n=1 Tax=Spiroplasma sp. ChiS TaxID=2099885 RepID=UPI00139238ED|nr:hypothetical protein [Spiroplasma sp. ChiS]